MKNFTQDAGTTSKRPPSLLIVEDSPDHWLLMESFLRQVVPRSQLSWATSSQTALDYLNQCLRAKHLLPNLILLDLYLPERTHGWQFLQIVKTHQTYQSIPVVVVSHSTDATDIDETYRRGGNSFITKPLDFSQWPAFIQHLKTYWCDAVTLPD